VQITVHNGSFFLDEHVHRIMGVIMGDSKIYSMKMIILQLEEFIDILNN